MIDFLLLALGVRLSAGSTSPLRVEFQADHEEEVGESRVTSKGFLFRPNQGAFWADPDLINSSVRFA